MSHLGFWRKKSKFGIFSLKKSFRPRHGVAIQPPVADLICPTKKYNIEPYKEYKVI